MSQVRILLVEDDADISALLAHFLRAEGYVVEQAYAGTEAQRLLEENPYDLLLLDLMLPGLSGEALFRSLSAPKPPVIIISGRVGMEDKCRLLEQGVDDYITKPFEKREVLARIKLALRHHQPQQAQPTVFEFSGLRMDLQAYELSYKDKAVALTQTEFEILKALLSAPTQVFTRDQLYEAVWQEPCLGDDNAITVHVSNLRRKLRHAAGSELIRTVWGIGYKLASDL